MIKGQKTAVVYDKWLDTLGGGEVVACNMARILKDLGYEVIFVCGKKISPKKIKLTLGIDLSDIKFEEVWNDEAKLRKIVLGKDLFINISFMDYSFGYAKKNIYYTLFPTEPYVNLKGKIFTEIILPLASKIIKPVEFIYEQPLTEIKNGNLAYPLEKPVKIAFSYLDKNKTYVLKFSLFLENFYFNLFNKIDYHIIEAEIINKQIKIDHYHNVIHFYIKIKPQSSTIYLEIIPPQNLKPTHLLEKDKLYLLYPKIMNSKMPDILYKSVYEKINTRLRAGLFINILERLKSYQLILADSEFTKKWVKNYWKREAEVLYPSVDLLFEKYDLSKNKKRNWICNVGRFFTLGHGKKQEVLIEALKKLYNLGYKDWELHLVGGLGKEPSSLKFAEYLKKQNKGYPIYFHFNVPRKKVEEILLKSKIYWHATGFGEDENIRPIKFEHFGIAPIEAMSTGCVPVLFNGGGLPDTINSVRLDPNLHLFNTIAELIEKTNYQILHYQTQSQKINQLYDKLTQNYDKKFFRKNFIELIK